MRFCIFGKPLRFSFNNSMKVIEAAMLLHNHIIYCRIDADDGWDRDYFHEFTQESHRSPDHVSMVSHNNEPRPRGRPAQNDDLALAEKGVQLRESLMIALSAAGLKQPTVTGMKYNAAGHVYMDY
jgi:hypothetical protein